MVWVMAWDDAGRKGRFVSLRGCEEERVRREEEGGQFVGIFSRRRGHQKKYMKTCKWTDRKRSFILHMTRLDHLSLFHPLARHNRLNRDTPDS
jgi:hypothetical protein